MKGLEVKTDLSDGHYKAMMRVIEAKGLTQAGYVRQLILQSIIQSEDEVCRLSEILARASEAP